MVFWYVTTKLVKLLGPTIFSSTYFTSHKLMLSLLIFPTFLPFVLISVFPLFWNLPLYSRVCLQINHYYFSEIMNYNAFLPVKVHSVIMNYCPLHSRMKIMIQKLLEDHEWVFVGFLVVKDGFSLMNPYCFWWAHLKINGRSCMTWIGVYQLTIKSPTIRRNKTNI